MSITGVIDTDLLVLSYLEDNDLNSICSSSNYMNTLCDESFWRLRFKAKYNATLESDHKSGYMHLRNLDELGIARYAIVNHHHKLLESLLPTIQEPYLIENLLRLAIAINNITVINMFIESTACDYEYVFIEEIIQNDNLELFKYIGSCGFSVFNIFSLEIAISMNALKVAQHLIDYDIKLSDRALARLFIFASFDIVNMLIKSGICNLGITCNMMENVVDKNTYDVIKLLLDNGGNKYATESLVFANNIDTARLILSYGAQITNKALCTAISRGKISLVTFFLDSGASLEVELYNPLEEAIYNFDIKMIKLLLKRGAKVHYDDYKVFKLAAGHDGVLDLLHKYG